MSKPKGAQFSALTHTRTQTHTDVHTHANKKLTKIKNTLLQISNLPAVLYSYFFSTY